MRDGWSSLSIGQVCDVIAGQSPDSKNYNDCGEGLPFYQGKKDFGDKHIGAARIWTTQITKEARNGDILMSVRAPVGPINIATEKVCIGRGLAAIRAKDAINRDFLYYGLLHKQSEIAGNDGAVFASINKSQIEKIKFSLPPLSEQKRIVAILDKAFEGIDKAIANTEKNLANAREMYESYLKDIFKKKAEERRVERIGDICKNLDNKRIPITKSKRQSGDIPYYGASGVVDYVADFIFDEDLLLVSEDGANLITRTYPIAFSISGKTWVNNHAHVLRFDNLTSQKFIERYLNSISLEPYVSGMAQPKINQKALNSISVPFPPIEQQAKMVESIEKINSESERLQIIYKQKIAALTKLKQSLLQKAFAGELTAKPERVIKNEAVA